MAINGEALNKFKSVLDQYLSISHSILEIELIDGSIEASIHSLYLGWLLTIKIFRIIFDYFDGPYVNTLGKHTSRYLVVSTK